jgi:antitoxin ParD1/3/4
MTSGACGDLQAVAPMRLAIFANPRYPQSRVKLNMPTRNINLTPEQDAFIAEVVAAGEYQNASEAIRGAVRALQQHRREDELKLKVLRSQIKAGAEALKRGEFLEINEMDLERYLEELAVTEEAG